MTVLRSVALKRVCRSMGLAIDWCDRHTARGYTCGGIMGSGERWVCVATIGGEPC